MYAGAMVFAAIGVAMVAWQFRFRTLLLVAIVLYGFIFVTAYKYGKLQAAARKARERAAAAQPPTAAHAEASPVDARVSPTHVPLPPQTARNLVEPGRPDVPASNGSAPAKD